MQGAVLCLSVSAILSRGFDNSPVRRPTATGNTSRVDCLDGNARLDCFSPQGQQITHLSLAAGSRRKPSLFARWGNEAGGFDSRTLAVIW